jgi:hypothetical protein
MPGTFYIWGNTILLLNREEKRQCIAILYYIMCNSVQSARYCLKIHIVVVWVKVAQSSQNVGILPHHYALS